MTNKLSSFAVFDLETASLPDLNFNKTSITEISIHGINAADIINGANCSEPRINHKLTLLFNPRMMIQPESEEITGLSNDMLEHESAFDVNAGNLIVNFLKHLQQPVCLVAHNGDKFDFPILKHSFSKLKMELPSDVLCLDSLPTIKSLDLAIEAEKDVEDFLKPLPDVDDPTCEGQKQASSNPNEDNVTVANNEDFIKIETNSKDDPNISEHSCSNDSESVSVPLDNEDQNKRQTFNETTPKRPPNVENINRKRKRAAEENLTTPVKLSSIPSSNSRKSLFPSEIRNYKLGSIYERMFGIPPENAHHAEADVIALKKIMLGYGKVFVDYAQQNAKPFSQVKKLGAR